LGILDLLDESISRRVIDSLRYSFGSLHRFDKDGSLFRFLLRLYSRVDWEEVLRGCTSDPDICVSRALWDEISGKQDPVLEKKLKIFLSSRPSSPHKRINLFLRWMVRDEFPDLGFWSGLLDRGRLLVPLGTEIARTVPRVFLGVTGELPRSRGTVHRIAKIFRTINPADPVKYDYVLSRPVILGLCNREIETSYCWVCPLRRICRLASILDLDRQRTKSIEELMKNSGREKNKAVHDKILRQALHYLGEKYIEPYNLVCLSDRGIDSDLRPDLLCDHGSEIVLVVEVKTSTKQKNSVIQLKTYIETLQQKQGRDKKYYAFLIYGRHDPIELQHVKELIQLTSLQHTADHIEIIVFKENQAKPIIIK